MSAATRTKSIDPTAPNPDLAYLAGDGPFRDGSPLVAIKNASERSGSGRFGQDRSGARHRENPYYIGRFSSQTNGQDR
jgi:hypothetical protein